MASKGTVLSDSICITVISVLYCPSDMLNVDLKQLFLPVVRQKCPMILYSPATVYYVSVYPLRLTPIQPLS